LKCLQFVWVMQYIFFVYFGIHPSPCYPIYFLSISLFYYIPHVLIYGICWEGTNQVSFLEYSQGFVVISHILYNMLEINVYSIVDSKVFGVKINVNFFLVIVEYKFNDYKHVMKVKKHATRWKECKRLYRLDK
jgi:hypothetical protein